MNANVTSPAFLWRLFKEAGGEWLEDNAMRLSAALSYYSVFSMAPLLLIVIDLASWFFGSSMNGEQIGAQLKSMLGPQAGQAMMSLLQSANQSGHGISVVGFITLLIGASGVFGELKSSLNLIWEVQPKSGLGIMGFIKQRLLTWGMVLAIGFLLLTSLVIAAIVAGLSGWMEHSLGIPKFVGAFLGYLLPLLVETALFALLFKMLPDAQIEWRSVWIGAAFTSILFEIGKVGLSFYLGKAAPESSFGAAGSVVLLILWVYYASCILFFGAELTEVYARLKGRSIQPAENAESTQKEGKSGTPAPAEPAIHQPTPAPAPPSEPGRESLAPMLARSLVPDPEIARRAQEEASWPDGPAGYIKMLQKRAEEHPLAELGLAVVAGLVLGALSRRVEEEALSPKEHLRRGAKGLSEDLLADAAEAANALRHRTDEAKDRSLSWLSALAKKARSELR